MPRRSEPVGDSRLAARHAGRTAAQLRAQIATLQAELAALEQGAARDMGLSDTTPANAQTAPSPSPSGDRLDRAPMWDQLLSALNHALRSPLAIVIGWSRMIREGKLNENELRGAGDAVCRSGTDLAQLIDDALEVGRTLAGGVKLRPAPLDIVAAVRDVLRDPLLQQHAADVQLTADLPSEELLVMADGRCLHRALVSLLVNVQKLAPSAGQMYLRVRSESGYVIIAVENPRIALTPPLLARLFDYASLADRLLNLDPARVLGLSLVRQLVELHDGRVQAELGALGRGARFSVRLPQPGHETLLQSPV